MRFLGFFILVITLAGCSVLSGGPTKKTTSNEDKARVFFRHGTKMIQTGKFTEGLKYLKQAVDLDGKVPEFWNHLALAYYLKKAYPEAESAFKRALALDESFTDVHHNLGTLYLRTNRIGMARKELLKATQDLTFLEMHKSYLLLAEIEERQGNLQQAKTYLLEAVKNNSTNCKIWYKLAEYELKDSQHLKAQTYLEKATHGVCYDSPQTHYELGKLYIKNEEFQKARRKFIELIQNFPQSKYKEQAKIALSEHELL